jgi:hypothetical protein
MEWVIGFIVILAFYEWLTPSSASLRKSSSDKPLVSRSSNLSQKTSKPTMKSENRKIDESVAAKFLGGNNSAISTYQISNNDSVDLKYNNEKYLGSNINLEWGNVETDARGLTTLAEEHKNLGVMYANGQGVARNDAEAVKWFTLAAEQENAVAQYNLGTFYHFGRGVTKNEAEAVKWYMQAAAQGIPVAQLNLGNMYFSGLGVAQNDAEAVKWYSLAAEQGNAVAQFNLGAAYHFGGSVAKNEAKAVKWYMQAAAQGNADAKFNLGTMYAKGLGVAQSDAEAVKWYMQAAAQGHANAQGNLGNMYFSGLGVAQNDAEAFKWYSQAATQGVLAAQSNLDLMRRTDKGIEQNDTTETSFIPTPQTQKLRKIVAEKNISYLLHFTRAKNLPSIMSNGLLSVEKSEQQSFAPQINDKFRWDNHRDATSISISHPNSRMFYKYRMEIPTDDWAVLILPTSILWEKNCAFCIHNAADRRIRHKSLSELTGAEAFADLFSDVDGVPSRAQQNLNPFEPTDIQAEVLVFNDIEPNQIMSVIFEADSTLDAYKNYLGKRKTRIDGINKGVFAMRDSKKLDVGGLF